MADRRGRPPKSTKGIFQKDLRLLMYGFGDEPDPAPDTIAVMEELVCCKAQKVAKDRKVNVEDFKFILRNDPKKLSRVEELLYMEQDIKRARQSFDCTVTV
ncbi:13619_t:CDS:2 [Entrophospora sp. SA101]|nr:3438_t:CDS:2 [Entrophospora candida]CAJ0874299.1 13619_t:CDS:2 [Entrophospora sp. SA101]